MRFSSLAVLVVFALVAPPSWAIETVLELRREVDGRTVDRITLLASDIDPNRRSADERFELRRNGEALEAPVALLGRLNAARRGYSYDGFTGGVVREDARARCMLGGPAIADRLFVRYLDFRDGVLVGSTMREVLTEPINCLADRRARPNEVSAWVAAAKALGALQALRDLGGEP